MNDKNVDTPVTSSSDTEDDGYAELASRLLEEIWHDVVVERVEYSPLTHRTYQW